MKAGIVIILILSTFSAWTQTDTTSYQQGEVLAGEITIEKEKQIILPQAEKIYSQSPIRNFSEEPLKVDFTIQEPLLEWPSYKTDVSFQTVNESYPEATYQNYIKAGYGNYQSPLFELGIYQDFGEWEGNAKAFFERFGSGPVFDENSGNAMGRIDLSASRMTDKFTFIPTISFQNNRFNYYGNTNRINRGFIDLDPVEGDYNHLTTNLDVNWRSGDIEIKLKPMISYANQFDSDSDGNTETIIGVNTELSYSIDEEFKTGFDLDCRSSSYRGGLDYNRSLLNINPWVRYRKDDWTARAGFMIASGTSNEESETGFYPMIEVEYNLSKKWSVFGNISGGQEWNSFDQLMDQNLFLDDSLIIVNTENAFSIGGGIKGSAFENTLLTASLTHSSLNGLPFFVPSGGDSSRYSLTYDTETVQLLSLNANLEYMPTTTSTYGIELTINSFSTESLERPWHKPGYILKAYTSHNIKEKLLISAHLTGVGGIRAPADVAFGYTSLSAFLDIGLEANYIITKRASAFIEVNNLLNNEYERYLGYPIRGLAFKIGGQYRF